jgi:hypothetical protein
VNYPGRRFVLLQMRHNPAFRYFLSPKKPAIQKDDKIWRKPLPLHRSSFIDTGAEKESISVSYGEYFCAVRKFLENQGFRPLIGAINCQLACKVDWGDLQKIEIFLEKHGEYYHPARVEARLDHRHLTFVVNVAISEAGKACCQNDYNNIKNLNDGLPYSFLPAVYYRGEVTVGANPFKTSLFLGQWLKGYHEFHLSRQPGPGSDQIVVWDPAKGAISISADQSISIYRQAAMILTAYYNPTTIEQVFAWHHAAGDFVVKLENGRVDVKLVTVRKYAPLFAGVESGTQTVFQTLLIFLLNLSIRMRLDRLDGVGQIVWAGPQAVQGTLLGFLDGLALQARHQLIPEQLAVYVRKYIKALSKVELHDLLTAIVGRYHSQLPELNLIRNQLTRHTAAVKDAIGHLF